MEESLVHESSLLDEQREEIQESLVDLFEMFIIPQMSHVINKVDTKHHGLEDVKWHVESVSQLEVNYNFQVDL